MKRNVRVWDVPTRLFHWSLVILIGFSIYTGEVGGFNEMENHMLSGYVLLGLILFRILWGLFGSYFSRFSSFVKLKQVFRYAKSVFNKDAKPSLGHNPLGALSIIALIVVVLVQAVTGLFADDDIFTAGPLTHLISDDTGDLLTSIHHINAKVLYVLIGLHLLAIAFYELYRGERLIIAMITGRKSWNESLSAGQEPKLVRELASALALAAMVASGVYYLVNFV